MQATLLYYYYLFCLVVTVCRVSSIMLNVHRTLPCKLELLLFLTRKNLHSGEAVPGVRCDVWRCYWSCWNVVKCNQFKRCKRNQYPYRSCHKFSRNLPQFCEAPPGLRLLHKRFHIVQLQVLCLWSSVIILQEGTCSKCIVMFLLVFFNQVFWAYLQKNTPTVCCKHSGHAVEISPLWCHKEDRLSGQWSHPQPGGKSNKAPSFGRSLQNVKWAVTRLFSFFLEPCGVFQIINCARLHHFSLDWNI